MVRTRGAVGVASLLASLLQIDGHVALLLQVDGHVAEALLELVLRVAAQVGQARDVVGAQHVLEGRAGALHAVGEQLVVEPEEESAEGDTFGEEMVFVQVDAWQFET